MNLILKGKNFTNNLTKQNKGFWKNEEVPGLIIWIVTSAI